MLTKLLEPDAGQKTSVPKEGELARVIQLWGNVFEIRYGYYEETDRFSWFAEPIEIYPNFLKEIRYTEEGMPFVTAIQSPCGYFNGLINENSTCADCSFYRHGEELIGLCRCPHNQKSPEDIT